MYGCLTSRVPLSTTSAGPSSTTRPAVLIADEPTTGLDATIQSRVLDLLEEMKAAFKTTTIALNMYSDTATRSRATQVAVTYSPTGSREDDREKILGLGLLRLLGGTWRR